MKRLIFLVVLLTGYCFGNEPQEQKEFNYKEIIAIAAIKGDKNCIFAGFPTFITMRDIISNAEKRFNPIVDAPPTFIYELFMVDQNGASATAFLGDHWLSDGTQISQLSDADFSFLIRVINARRFENNNSILESLTREVNIAGFKNELLKTEDYESVGRQPKDKDINYRLESPASNSNTKPIDQEDGKPKSSKNTASSESSSTKQALGAQEIPQTRITTLNTENNKIIEKAKAKESEQEEILPNKEKTPKLTFLVGLIVVVGLVWRWMKR